ncbi:MAG: VirB4 family type IV secretion/conjugal transfer ATPase, partial [Proteobacteria bacterium]|nr:VirB4 family type IV secretion/conjugal transfer ATPase [Pseudomonadota bacterium]
MKHAAAMSREAAVAQHIPYAAHVAPNVVRTLSGDYVQAFRLAGASFESADDEALNNWHERLNVTWRNLAAPHVALWTHVIRRRETVSGAPVEGTGFADQLAAKYQQRLSGETLMVNEICLCLVYRPVTGAATGLAAKWLSRRARGANTGDLADALDVCEKLGQTLRASLARYEPEGLGVYTRSERAHSRLLEFLALLVNGQWQPVPLPRAPLNEALATTRLIFGSEVIEYRLATRTRVGAMLGIKEYPTPTTVGMLNALLSAPFEFVLTQSFSFLTKATGQGLLQRQ